MDALKNYVEELLCITENLDLLGASDESFCLELTDRFLLEDAAQISKAEQIRLIEIVTFIHSRVNCNETTLTHS